MTSKKVRILTLSTFFLILSSILTIPIILAPYPSNNWINFSSSTASDALRYIRDPTSYTPYGFGSGADNRISVIFNGTKSYITGGGNNVYIVALDDDFLIDYQRVFLQLSHNYATQEENLAVSWGSGGSMWGFQGTWQPDGFWSDGVGHNFTFTYNAGAGADRGNIYFDGALFASSGANPAMNVISNINFTGFEDINSFMSASDMYIDHVYVRGNGVTQIDDDITDCDNWLVYSVTGYTTDCYDLGIPPEPLEDWTIDTVTDLVGGYPTNETETIIEDILNGTIDEDRGYYNNTDNIPIDGIANTTDNTVSGQNFTNDPATFFYQLSVPDREGASGATISRVSFILGDNFTGRLLLGLYVASNLQSKLNTPISADNPAIIVKYKEWYNPVKGIYFMTPNYAVSEGQTIAFAISAYSGDPLYINETTSTIRQLFIVFAIMPYSISSPYYEIDSTSSLALWGEIDYEVIQLPDGTIPDEGQRVIPRVDVSENTIWQNFVAMRGGLGMGVEAGGYFMGLIFTFIVLFLTVFIASRLNQQLPNIIYIGMFILITAFNTYAGFYPIWTIIVIIFITAIMTVMALRNVMGGTQA